MYRYSTLLYYILCIYNMMLFHFSTLTQVCVKELADYDGEKEWLTQSLLQQTFQLL